MKLGPTFQTLGLVLLLSHVTPAAGQGCAPQLNFAPFLTFCQGNSVTLNATNPNATYLWNTGDTTATLTITTSGTYWVTATNPCGTASDTIQVVVAQPLVVNLGPDFNLCTSGGSQLLQAPTAPLTTYQWQDGSTGSSYSVSTPGTYWVKVNNGCGAFFDTVTVGMDTPPVVSFGPDQQLCIGQQTTLSMTSTGGVLWSTGATTSPITVSTAGTYWGKVTNGCGTFSDTIVISFSNAPALNLPASTLLCNGTATLNAGSAPGTYAWSTGATGSQITVNAIGTYWVTLTTPCGATTDTIQVVNPATLSLNLGPDTTFCQGSITLNAQSPGMSVTWDNGSTGQTRTVSSSGTYWATVSNGCASATDTSVVTVIPNPANSLADTLYTCAGTPFVVNLPAYGGFATYTWSNGQTGPVAQGLAVGQYSVTVQDATGCTAEGQYDVKQVQGNYYPTARIDITDQPDCTNTANKIRARAIRK